MLPAIYVYIGDGLLTIIVKVLVAEKCSHLDRVGSVSSSPGRDAVLGKHGFCAGVSHDDCPKANLRTINVW